jgi:uncharacterized protein with PIN domain
MIVDTSETLAVLFNESDAETYARAIARADSRRMSAANFVEAAIVVETQTKRERQPPVRWGATSLYGFRKGSSCGRAEFRGLLCLRPCQS